MAMALMQVRIDLRPKGTRQGIALKKRVDYQRTVSNLPLTWISAAKTALTGKKRRVQILNTLDGVLEAGEMLVVLGPPGRQVLRNLLFPMISV